MIDANTISTVAATLFFVVIVLSAIWVWYELSDDSRRKKK